MSQQDQAKILATIMRDHLQHDLTEDDRAALQKAGRRFMGCVAVGLLIGSAGAARFTFTGRYAPSKLRSLPRLFNPKTESLDRAVLQDRLTFFGRAFLLTTVGLVFGGQLGVSAGYYASNAVLEREGNRERITKAISAAQQDASAKLGGPGRPAVQQRASRSRASGIEDQPEMIEGENTSLSAAFEREQQLGSGEMVDDSNGGATSQKRFIPPSPGSGGEAPKRTRWQELQNASQKPSKWESIRQEQGKAEMKSSSSSATSRGASGQSAAQDSFDEASGIKGRDYAAEQAAFDKLMEQERRGGQEGFLPEGRQNFR